MNSPDRYARPRALSEQNTIAGSAQGMAEQVETDRNVTDAGWRERRDLRNG